MRWAARIWVAATLLVSLAGCGTGLKDTIVISTTSLPGGAVNVAYSVTLQVTGGTAPYTWVVTSGSPPAGLTLSSGGVLSGTPTAAGTSTFTVHVDDSDRKTLGKDQSLSLTINTQLQITTASLLDGVSGRSYTTTLVSTGGAGAVRWSVSAGSLPSGMTFSAAGLLSGTPGASGTFTFTASVSDTGPPVQTATKQFTLVVQPALAIANTGLSNGAVNTPYEQILTATGGVGAYTWSVVDPALDPPGLSFTVTGPTTGTYTGTPAASGRFTFILRVTDTGNAAVPAASADFTFRVLILNAPAAYVANSGDGTVSVLDIASNTVTTTITVGTTPTGVAVSPDGATAYVTNKGSNTVSVIDTLTNAVTSTVTVGTGPVGVVAVADGKSVFAANQTGNTVSVIDTTSNTVTTTIPIPFANSRPTGLAASGDGRFVFLSLQGSDKVVVISNDPTSPAFHLILAVLDLEQGAQPATVAFAPVTSKIYVANPGKDSVTLIDVNFTDVDFTVGTTVSLADTTTGAPPTQPVGVGVGPNCNLAHVTTAGAGELTAIDTVNDEAGTSISLGGMPQQIAFNSDGTLAYVTNSGLNRVHVIQLSTNTVTASITVGPAPLGIAVPPDPSLRLIPIPPPPRSQLPTAAWSTPYGIRVCAAGGLPPYTLEADTAEIPPGLDMDEQGLIKGEPSTPSVAFNPSDPRFAPLHKPNEFTFTVTVTDAATQKISGDFLLNVCCWGFPPLAYIANFGSNDVTVVRVDLDELVTTIPAGLGTNPLAVAARPDGRRIYVTNFNSNNVSVIDSEPDSTTFNTVIATVTVGDGPAGIAITPDGSRAYVTNEDAGTVTVINTADNTVLGSISLGTNSPEGIAIRPDGRRAYVANIFSNNVSVIDTDPASGTFNTVIATVAVGQGPVAVAVAVTGSQTLAYITNQFSDSVSVIDTSNNTVIATVPVGNFPTGIAIMASGTRAYVANQLDDSVSVIDIGSNTEIDMDPSTPEKDRITVGTTPDFVAILTWKFGTTLFDTFAYVGNFSGGDLTIIDINSFSENFHKTAGTVGVGSRPEGLAIRFPP